MIMRMFKKLDIANKILPETDANAIIPAKIGVEQGVPASAKIILPFPPLFQYFPHLLYAG